MKVLLLFVTFFSFLFTNAQESDPILLTINGEQIPKSEFIRIYKKNIATVKDAGQKSMNDYLEMFINFKLKVIEAKSLGMDTVETFKAELNKYRQQLAASYLTDKETDEKLMEEAYERLKFDINADHILIKLGSYATPEDTLVAYKKAMKVRQRILDGEAFDVVAKGTSDDPSVKANGGNVGYFTAFQMVYPFECAAYQTKPGDVSLPIRTDYGYHIIKVNDKRDAVGKVRVAHIMIMLPQGSDEAKQNEAKEKIYDVYNKLKSGEDFVELANKYSEDPGSARNGGELPWFGPGRMVPEFEKASFDLSFDGAISEPIKTFFGWHIIKRLEREEISTMELAKGEIKSRISRDQRSMKSQEVLVGKLKKEYGFSEDLNALGIFNKIVTDSVFSGTWRYNEEDLGKPLFKIKGNNYLQKDFARYIVENVDKTEVLPIKFFIEKSYKSFVQESILSWENKSLEGKYPDFKYLVQEYRDGILLFELTDKVVWSKAVNDSIGLKQFYDTHKNNYLMDDQVSATIYECATSDVANKLNKLFKKKSASEYRDEDVFKALKMNVSDSLLVIKHGEFKDGENKMVDKQKKKLGLSSILDENNKFYLVNVISAKVSEVKPFENTKAMVVIDYQGYLEKEWIKGLREKYKISVDDSVFTAIDKNNI